MKGIKKMLERFEKVMSAAAFAEAGEFGTAEALLKEEKHKRKQPAKRFEASLAASSMK